ncbi:MAG: putative lipid II flippase FtsW [Patescibacteria group bacterium]
MQTRLVWTIGILLVLGLVMLSSAGIMDGQKKFGSPYYYLKHQLLFGVLPGLVLAWFLSRINYRFWRGTSWLVLFGALTLMILVFTPKFGVTLNGARSWLSIGGYVFQPAEFLKLGLIIYLAAWCGERDERVKNWTYGILPFVLVMGFVALLLLLQPDLGTFILVAAIALGVYFIAGVHLKDLIVIISIAFILVGGMILVQPYRLDRIKAFLNPSVDPRGISYQLNQSFIAIGSGGVFGVGYGNSTQKSGFLPEPVGDSIFAIIVEELGLVGAGFTIGLFLFLAFTLASIAKATSDAFGRLFVMGMNIWIVGQALVNIAAITGLAPLTGVPLPFISYGGTALVSLLAGLGIVFNIAKRV